MVNQKFYKKATKQRGPGDTYKERERGGKGARTLQTLHNYNCSIEKGQGAKKRKKNYNASSHKQTRTLSESFKR